VTLAYVFTASDKPASQYCNPATGDVCSGRGMKPTWLKGYEAEYQVKAN
jgi:DNA-binding protein H-NS